MGVLHLKKDNFKRGEEAERAFKRLKKAMTTIPVLALLDFSQSFIIESNALGHGLGAVIV